MKRLDQMSFKIKRADQLRLVYQQPLFHQKIKPVLLKMKNMQYSETELKRRLKDFRDKGSIERQNYQVRLAYNYYRTPISPKRQQRKDSFNLDALQHIQDIRQFYSRIAAVILKGQNNPPSLPIIRSGTVKKYQLIKGDILLVLSMMSAFLIPKQRLGQKFSKINDFSHIFCHEFFKTKCIVQYLKGAIDNKFDLKQRLQIVRLVETASVGQLMNSVGDKYQMFGMTLKQNNSDIQSQQFYGKNYLKVDFANKKVGGGSLENGLIQEEIMVANRPEMYAALIIVQQLNDDEAIVFKGFRKYYKSTGYGETTKYDGRERITSPDQTIVAIDAIHFRKHQVQNQYLIEYINREIKKAYTGFKYNKTTDIVSGNWGCGSFNGDHQLKALIQWIAASLAQKHLHHCPYGFKTIIQNPQLFKIIRKMRIKVVYQILLKACCEMRYYSSKTANRLYFAMMSAINNENIGNQNTIRKYYQSNQKFKSQKIEFNGRNNTTPGTHQSTRQQSQWKNQITTNGTYGKFTKIQSLSK